MVPLTVNDDPGLRDSHRHYAATDTETLEVFIHQDAFKLRPSQTLAILLHELGHVVEHAQTTAGHALVEHPDAPTPEEDRADWIAEQVFGVKISYDPKTKVQTLDRGLPRPEGLK